MPHIGILEMGCPSYIVTRQKHGTYADMFRAFFAQQTDITFSVFKIYDGDAVPVPQSLDGWIISGSPSAVYEDHKWLPAMRDFVRAALAASIPTLGICFGHQLMAQAMGGIVEKSDKGRCIGVHTYTLSEAGKKYLHLPQPIFNMAAMHQDQVVKVPDSAIILAHSSFCPNGILSYGQFGLSFQAHPEYTADIGRDTTQGWQKKAAIDPALYEKALASYDSEQLDSPKLVPLLREFLGRHVD
jgi:GMP synthase (glutamine-hydrolysing)